MNMLYHLKKCDASNFLNGVGNENFLKLRSLFEDLLAEQKLSQPLRIKSEDIHKVM